MEADQSQLVRIHIDQKPYHSPSPTTGDALYVLANIAVGVELFREVDGDREDQPVPRAHDKVHLKLDEHFHSGALEKGEVTIYVDEKPFEIHRGKQLVSAIKSVAGVPAVDQLSEENSEGGLTKLAQDGSVKIKGGEKFVSFPATGGSS